MKQITPPFVENATQPNNPPVLAKPSFITFFLSASLSVSTHAAISVGVVGVYDEATTTNSVDRNASGNSLASGNPNDIAGFTDLVATAFANNTGGVIHFDGGTGNNQNQLDVTYGGGKTFAITTNGNNSNNNFNIGPFSSMSEISGANGLLPSSTATNIFRFTFGTISTGETISSAGFTLLSRDSFAQGVLVEWFLNGSTTVVAASQPIAMAGAQGTDDTFFSYTAPEGSRISSFRISYDTGGAYGSDERLAIDDLSFITIPEPSSILLLGVASASLLGRRKRNA